MNQCGDFILLTFGLMNVPRMHRYIENIGLWEADDKNPFESTRFDSVKVHKSSIFLQATFGGFKIKLF